MDGLETTRLILQPLALDDAPRIQAIFPRWEIVKYLANVVPWPYPPDGAQTFIEKVALPGAARGDEWDWTLRLRTNPEALIGSIGLVRTGDTNRGFWIAPQWQGQGLMSEAAHAVTDFWFDVLKFPLLRVTKAVANTASSRITAKQGMRLVGTKEGEYVCGCLPAEIWEISAEEWRARRKIGQ